MIQRFDALVDGTQAACIELVGYDAKPRTYPVQTFYNNGSSSKWQLTERDGTWILTGKSEVGGKPTEVRCTTVYSEANCAMMATWEYSIDGTLCAIVDRRQHGNVLRNGFPRGKACSTTRFTT